VFFLKSSVKGTVVLFLVNKKLEPFIHMDILKTLNDIFPLTHFYYEYIPSYSSLWGFAACSQKYSPHTLSPAAVDKRLKKRNLDSLSYYDKETHTKLFLLPGLLRNFR
jgi:spermidine synthase